MDDTNRSRKVAKLAAAFAAVAASAAIGTALAAPPMKNAGRVCTKLGAAFAADASQYTCSGNDPTKAYAFLEAPQRQCLNSYKGTFGFQILDYVTGDWRYTCSLA